MPRQTPEGQFDMTLQKQTIDYCNYLRNIHTNRNGLFNMMEQMFLLVWGDESKVKAKMENVKITKHPGSRIKMLGALRLLIATDPQWEVSKRKDDPAGAAAVEPMEQMADTLWKCAGRVRGAPVHYDAILSALLFAEMHIAITRTSDRVESSKGASKAAQAQAEAIAETTPYLFDVWDPRSGYPDIGPMGLTAFYSEIETTVGRVLDEFGDDAKAIYKDKNRYGKTTLCRFWDNENRLIWVSGHSRPLKQEKLDTSFIPITVQLGEGSRLFSLPEHQRQPFLYTDYQSGIWARLNLWLTVLNTVVFAIGTNPMYLYKANQAGKTLSIDHGTPGGVATIEKDEDFGPIVKNVIDPSMMTLYQTLTELQDQSTIYGQALGESLGGNAPFSMVALLHQAGRLPLIVPQRLGGWGLADAMKKALLWMRESGVQAKAGYGEAGASLKPSDIPKSFELNCNLDINLPQDMLNQAQVAKAVTEGDNPLASNEWAREHLLKIGQPAEMQRQIWSEQAGAAQFVAYIQDMLQRAQAMANQGPGQVPGQVPGQAGPPSPQGPPQEGMLEGIPPEMAQYGQQGPMQPPGMPPRNGRPPIE